MPNLDQIALDTVEAIANIDPDKLKGGRVQAVAQAQCLVRDAMRVVEADRDALVNRVDFLNQQNSAQQEQNDELAAHVEAIDHPATLFIESAQDVIELLEAAGEARNIVDLRQVLTEAADGLADALNNTPATSLARLKAEGIHRAVCILESEFDPCHPIIERLEQIEAEERRQANQGG